MVFLAAADTPRTPPLDMKQKLEEARVYQRLAGRAWALLQ